MLTARAKGLCRALGRSAILGVLVAVSLLALATARGIVHKSDYQGHVVSDPHGRVELELIGGATERVRLVARNIRLICDGGKTPRVDLESIRARLTSRGTFRAERYFAGQTKQVFYQGKGALQSRGRASGTLLYFDDLVNQEEPVPPGDCSTQRRVPWRATQGRASPVR